MSVFPKMLHYFLDYFSFPSIRLKKHSCLFLNITSNMFLVKAVYDRYYHEKLVKQCDKKGADIALIPHSLPVWFNCTSSLKPDLVSVCTSISSICSHHSLLSPPPLPCVSSSSSLSYSLLPPFPFHSLHPHHSLYVQGTVAT